MHAHRNANGSRGLNEQGRPNLRTQKAEMRLVGTRTWGISGPTLAEQDEEELEENQQKSLTWCPITIFASSVYESSESCCSTGRYSLTLRVLLDSARV